MLSHQTTIPRAARIQKNRLARYLGHLQTANSNPASAQRQKQDDGAPVERNPELFKCNQDTILNMISPEKSCDPSQNDESRTAKMPQFDDLTAYLLTEQDARNLWGEEAARLKEAIEKYDSPLSFSNKGFFGDGNEEGYKNLAKLAEMILAALSLCLLDNECIYVEFCKPLANRNRVEKLIQQARVSQTNGEWEEGGQTSNSTSTLEAIYSLVDYISAVLARLVSQVATGRCWCDNAVAVLTQRVTKLKVLLLDMHTNTVISCQAGEALLNQTDISNRLSNGILDEEECEEVLRMIDAETKEGLATAAIADAARYCVDQNRLRSGIDAIIRYILLSLRFQNRSGLSGTSFEICGMVYETGVEDFKALLFQDLDLEYSASSDQDTLNTAYPAFSILNQIMKQISKKGFNEPPKNSQTNKSLRTMIEWTYLEANKNNSCPNPAMGLAYGASQQKCHVEMRAMEDIITAMIPLLLTSPMAVANLTSYRTMMALTSGTQNSVQPFREQNYTAFFRMYTNKFEDDSKTWDVMRLSIAVDKQVFSRCALISGKDFSKRSDEKMAVKMAEVMQEMDRWIIDETGITVACKFQVWSVLIVAFIIAGGGLSIMATGNRISGVDPSNLSTYLWVVAGVYLLICKSRFVEDWPWSDFLHFRVRCRSVSELHAISGINEQFIMAKLLHDERGGSELKTRGPYNKAFLQRDSTDGFSIDCPLQMKTLLLSGLIMLKVVTPRGHALVCLDARRGTELKVVEHQGNQAQEHLICEDIHRLQDRRGKKKSEDKTRLQLMRSKELKWKRVQGVYGDMNAEFV
ncbi:hypothetical protein MKX08_007715 [Trichoderma sp. CBMAI-0020]|nr:hypothetical protein MKX08_007715 [Trichoderma sp. CBMAI-0020]